RIDDGDVVVEHPRQRRQRLADMHRADHDEPRRRRVHVAEQLFAADLDGAALARAQLRLQHLVQRIAGDVGGLDQALVAAGDVGDADRRAARGALGIEGEKGLRGHDAAPLWLGASPSFSPNTRMVPPHDSPTCQAVSSATPNSRSFGAPEVMTSSASVTTAPSTQPPETEPRNEPSSLM